MLITKSQIKIILTDLWQFIKRPNDEQLSLPFADRIRLLLTVIVFEFVLLFLLIFPILWVVDYLLPLQNLYLLEQDTLYDDLFLAVIVAPLFEELVFRFSLRYRKIYTKLFPKERWNRVFPYLVYLTACLFGLIHISNYDNDSVWLYVLAPLIILSQAFGGLTIAFVRVRLNFAWGLFYHALWNLVLILVTLFTFTFDTEYTKETPDYSLTIHEQPYYEEDKPQDMTTIYATSDYEVIYDIDVDQHTVNYVISEIYGEGEYYADEDFFITMDFHSDTGVTKEALLEVLQERYDIEKLDATSEALE